MYARVAAPGSIDPDAPEAAGGGGDTGVSGAVCESAAASNNAMGIRARYQSPRSLYGWNAAHPLPVRRNEAAGARQLGLARFEEIARRDQLHAVTAVIEIDADRRAAHRHRERAARDSLFAQ